MRRDLCHIVILIATLVAIGCTSDPRRKELADKARNINAPATRALKPIDPLLLRADVRAGLDRWLSSAMALTSQITAQTTRRDVREACLRLKIRAATAARIIGSQSDPRTSFLLAWIMAVQFRDLHTTGEYKNTFGEQQPLVVEAANQAIRNVIEMGRRHFPADEIDAAIPEIEQLASQVAMGERFLADRMPLALASGTRQLQANAVGRLLAAPLSPLTSLQGVADTPQAINNVAIAMGEFGQIFRDSPELLRWHLELLMYEANDLPVIVDARRDFERLAAAFQQLATKVDTLPDDLRAELAALLKQSDESQARLQGTLVEARQTLDSLNVTLDKAAATSQNVTAATQAIAQLTADKPDAAPSQRDPVTVEQVSQLLDRANALATELRELTGQLQRPLPPDSGLGQTLADAQQRADASIAAAADRIDQSIDTLTWRGVILIAAAFAAAVVYRLIFHRRSA